MAFADAIAAMFADQGPERQLAELERAYQFEERVFVRARYRDERRCREWIDLGGES